MSKASFGSNKWLILRSRTSSDPAVDLRHDDADTGLEPPPQSRRRSPTGHPGLPSDWLFSVALESVIIVEAITRRIVQANQAAAQLLQRSTPALIGSSFIELFDTSGAVAVMRCIETADAAGAAEVSCCTAGDGSELRLRLSMFRTDADRYLLVRLGRAAAYDGLPDASPSPVFDAIEGASVGFLLTDSGFRVEYANQAFIDMVELLPPARMEGKSLVRWLELSASDLARLRKQMSQRHATSVITARLRTEHSTGRDVEVCAVAVPDGQHTCWGFTIRELPRLN